MSVGVLLITIGVLLALAIYSVRETIAQSTQAKRDARILGLVLASLIGLIPMGIVQSVVTPAISFWLWLPFGLVMGVAAYEVGPAIKKLALKVLGRRADEIAVLTVERPVTAELEAPDLGP